MLLRVGGGQAMNEMEARNYAISLILKWGLKGWRFVCSGRRLAHPALCHFKTKTIEIPRGWVEANASEKVKELILHEIAHALSGRRLHDGTWKATARIVGCEPSAHVRGMVSPPLKYGLKCDWCGTVSWFARKVRVRRSCRQCGGARFNERFLLREITGGRTR